MRRGGALALLWILATVGAVSLARLAVGAVADEVTNRSVQPLSPRAVSEALEVEPETTATTAPDTTTSLPATVPTSVRPGSPTTVPGGTATSTPNGGDAEATTSTTAPVVTTTQAYTAEGGSVTVRFSCGTTADLVSASPNPGYQVEIKDDGPEQVDVEFESGDHRSRIRARCANGQPTPEITEESDGGAED